MMPATNDTPSRTASHACGWEIAISPYSAGCEGNGQTSGCAKLAYRRSEEVGAKDVDREDRDEHQQSRGQGGSRQHGGEHLVPGLADLACQYVGM